MRRRFRVSAPRIDDPPLAEMRFQSSRVRLAELQNQVEHLFFELARAWISVDAAAARHASTQSRTRRGSLPRCPATRSAARDRRRDSPARGAAGSGPARAPASGSDRPGRSRADRSRHASVVGGKSEWEIACARSAPISRSGHRYSCSRFRRDVARAILWIEDAHDAIDLVFRRPVELADVAVVPNRLRNAGSSTIRRGCTARVRARRARPGCDRARPGRARPTPALPCARETAPPRCPTPTERRHLRATGRAR